MLFGARLRRLQLRKRLGNLQCELCNKSHLQVTANHVMVAPGFIFRPVAEVFVFFFPQYLLTFSEEDLRRLERVFSFTRE